jgi:hypothetical protein
MRSVSILIGLVLLTGCASYRAMPLNTVYTHTAYPQPWIASDVIIVAKAFDKYDCKHYLDRDVITQGYRPVQIYIENKSEKNYLFSVNRVSLPCARPEEVAEKVHTSTIARAAGYGAAALIFWPFVVPAVVDGVASAQANDALDADFATKTARDQVIASHSHANMLLFVPIDSFQSVFSLTLVDLNTNQPREFIIHTLLPTPL